MLPYLPISWLRYMFLLLCFLVVSGCQSVKPWQRPYLNDHEMQLGNKSIERLEYNSQAYREAATGGGFGKSSGGCGCN